MAGKKDKDTERAFQQVLKIVEDTDSVEQEFKRLEVNIMNIMCCVQRAYDIWYTKTCVCDTCPP